MATVDNSKIFLEGAYSDATVKVPGETTFKKGLILGRDENGDLTAFTSENEGSEPLYILAQDIINEEEKTEDQAASLVARSDNGTRSFKIEAAPPEGQSYARDIAAKYGVTFEQLVRS